MTGRHYLAIEPFIFGGESVEGDPPELWELGECWLRDNQVGWTVGWMRKSISNTKSSRRSSRKRSGSSWMSFLRWHLLPLFLRWIISRIIPSMWLFNTVEHLWDRLHLVANLNLSFDSLGPCWRIAAQTRAPYHSSNVGGKASEWK